MKKLLPLLLCVLLLCGCTAEGELAADASLADICAELINAAGDENAVVLNSEYITVYYGLDDSRYTEASVFMVPRSILQSEVVLVKAKDEAAFEEIRSTLQLRLESLRGQARDYDTESAALLEHTEVYANAPYCALFFHPMQDELKTAFEAHLKQYAPGEAPVFTPAPMPTAEPTPTPTEEPTPMPTEEPAAPEETRLPYGLVPERERAEDSWFDDALFIGNSVAKNLENYVLKQRLGEVPDCMGKAVFFTAGQYGWKNAALDIGYRPSLNGHYYTPFEAVGETQAQKVYFSMFQVDYVYQEMDEQTLLDYALQVIAPIREAYPSADIYLCSLSPRAALFEGFVKNNAAIRSFNEILLRFCEENELYYLDCYTPLADENGCLAQPYVLETNEGGVHLTAEGCRVWMEYLYTHTAN